MLSTAIPQMSDQQQRRDPFQIADIGNPRDCHRPPMTTAEVGVTVFTIPEADW